MASGQPKEQPPVKLAASASHPDKDGFFKSVQWYVMCPFTASTQVTNTPQVRRRHHNLHLLLHQPDRQLHTPSRRPLPTTIPSPTPTSGDHPPPGALPRHR